MDNLLALYTNFLWVMAAIAVVVFVALHFFEAGYGGVGRYGVARVCGDDGAVGIVR